MLVNPNNEDRRARIRGPGYDGDSYNSPNEYDSGQLTQIVPDGTGMPTAGYVENRRYGVGSPSAYKKFSEIHKTSGRALPTKRSFKVNIK